MKPAKITHSHWLQWARATALFTALTLWAANPLLAADDSEHEHSGEAHADHEGHDHAETDASEKKNPKPRRISTTSDPIEVTGDTAAVDRVAAITPEDLGFFIAQLGLRGRGEGYDPEARQAFGLGVAKLITNAEPSPETVGFLVAQQIGLNRLQLTEEEVVALGIGIDKGMEAGIDGREEAIALSQRIQGYLRAREQNLQQERLERIEAAAAARSLSEDMQQEIINDWKERDPMKVVLETTKGDITLELMPARAPLAVANFVTHIEQDYYDGVIFHRVIDGFMIQGGDPQGTGTGGESVWGKPFPDEVHDDLKFDEKYLLAMANAGPVTNGSQFFITVSEPSHLHRRHTIFGKVVEGKKVVDTIAKVQVGPGDKPVEDVVINDAKVL
ncbi:MAG: peptidylprolyl isomerase [Opitutales bacterium]